jgi:hypothetical protein
VIVGYKTRAVIKTRVTDPIVRKDVKLLAAVGAGMHLLGLRIDHLLTVFSNFRRWIWDLEPRYHVLQHTNRVETHDRNALVIYS